MHTCIMFAYMFFFFCMCGVFRQETRLLLTYICVRVSVCACVVRAKLCTRKVMRKKDGIYNTEIRSTSILLCPSEDIWRSHLASLQPPSCSPAPTMKTAAVMRHIYHDLFRKMSTYTQIKGSIYSEIQTQENTMPYIQYMLCILVYINRMLEVKVIYIYSNI